MKLRISTSGGWSWNRDEIEKKLKSNLGEQTIQGVAKSTSISDSQWDSSNWAR